jgi:hypothetical protein
MELDSYVKEDIELDEVLSDVLTGLLSLVPQILTNSFDVTIPHKHENVKIFVPCPKATDNFLALCLFDYGPCVAANHRCVLVCR